MKILRIGITGSYGKTSCKNIITALLSTKYKVFCTKGNHNTESGISGSIEELKDEEIFVAEMGAKRVGDIKKLCDIVKPNYGIITGVTKQHMDTFDSVDSIIKTKNELSDYIPDDGTVVFNSNNLYTSELYEKRNGKKLKVGFSLEDDYYADDIKITTQGLSFCVNHNNTKMQIKTRLLGRNNIINILLCIALAKEFNIENEDIVRTIGELKPTPHRLELIKTSKVTIIDDSYNANIEGVAGALEVLGLFNGRKIVLSQGIVECGKDEKQINEQIGEMVSKVADLVLLCGKNTRNIKTGLIKSGFPKSNIIIYKSLKEAEKNFDKILKKGDIVLFQNDIP